MPRRPLVGWVGLLVVAIVAGGLTPVSARAAGTADRPLGADKSAAELLPASTLFYAEIAQPQQLIAQVLDNPAFARLIASPQYQGVLDQPQFKQLVGAVKLVEERSGVKWRQALETITGGGLTIAIEPSTQAGVLLARSTDAKTTAAVRDALLGLAREDAKAKGNPDPVNQTKYRELTAYKSGENTLVEMGPWLVSASKPGLAKMLVDAYLDGPAPGESLAESEEFVEARAFGNADQHTGWAFVRLPPLRLLALQQPWMKPNAKSDNPGAELIFGGLMGVVQKAPYATMSIDASADGIKLAVAAPHDPEWVPAERQFYFAPADASGKVTGGAAKPFKPKGLALSITTYRDFGAMWQNGPDLFTEAVAAQMAQTDSGLSTFLGGKSFGTDVLPSFQPQFQFIVAAQDYARAGVPAPGIRIPAMASVIRLKPEQANAVGLRKHLRVAFQSLVALGNLDGAAKNRPMLELGSEKRGAAEIHWAVYDQEQPLKADASPAATGQAPAGAEPTAKAEPDAAAPAKTKDDIHYNFSPALAVAPDYLILCSTRELAQELVDLATADAQAGQAAATIAQNTLIEMDAGAIAGLLRDNREQFIAQNMLSKGHGHDAASAEIDFLVGLVDYFRAASLKLTPTEKSIALEIEIKTAAGK
jgi:hypothetical protein